MKKKKKWILIQTWFIRINQPSLSTYNFYYIFQFAYKVVLYLNPIYEVNNQSSLGFEQFLRKFDLDAWKVHTKTGRL